MNDEDIVSRTCNFSGTEEEEYGRERERGRRWKQLGFLISNFVIS